MGVCAQARSEHSSYGILYFMRYENEAFFKEYMTETTSEALERYGCPSYGGHKFLYQLYVWYSFTECDYLYMDVWLPIGLGEQMVINKELKIVGMAKHQGEKMIKYKFTHLKYPPIRTNIPKEIKLEVLERDNYQCKYCRSSNKLEIDHIIPVAKGGDNNIHNLQVLCQHCNRTKHAKII